MSFLSETPEDDRQVREATATETSQSHQGGGVDPVIVKNYVIGRFMPL